MPGNLTSKLQYKGFEPGEFTAIAERTLPEIIELVKQYPWNEQRHLTPIGLTAPSVTIQNNDGDYLKVGAGYYSRFTLYLLTANGRLFRKIVDDIDEVLPFVHDFFDGKDIEPPFERYKGITNAEKHFITKQFEYTVDQERIFSFIVLPSVLYSILFFLPPLLAIPKNASSFTEAMIAMSIIWFPFVGIDCLFFINYYRYSKDLFIKISQGLDSFLYGEKDNPHTYSKADITEIRYYEPRGSKNPWGNNNIIEVEFKNGEVIKFPNLLIGTGTFFGKIKKTPIKRIYKNFPFI